MIHIVESQWFKLKISNLNSRAIFCLYVITIDNSDRCVEKSKASVFTYIKSRRSTLLWYNFHCQLLPSSVNEISKLSCAVIIVQMCIVILSTNNSSPFFIFSLLVLLLHQY